MSIRGNLHWYHSSQTPIASSHLNEPRLWPNECKTWSLWQHRRSVTAFKGTQEEWNLYKWRGSMYPSMRLVSPCERSKLSLVSGIFRNISSCFLNQGHFSKPKCFCFCVIAQFWSFEPLLIFLKRIFLHKWAVILERWQTSPTLTHWNRLERETALQARARICDEAVLRWKRQSSVDNVLCANTWQIVPTMTDNQFTF